MIKITDSAKIKLREIAQEQGLDKLILRVKVIGGGCAGYQFDFYFEEMPATEMDDIFCEDDISIIVDMLSNQYLDGTLIDYENTNISGGFKFINPNITKTCGCGNSFSY